MNTPTQIQLDEFKFHKRQEILSDRKIIRKYFNHLGYTDVNPFELIKTISPITVEIRSMKCVEQEWKRDFHPGGFFGHTSNQSDQKWSIESDPTAEIIRVRWSVANGCWRDKHGNTYRSSDTPTKFYDFNF